MDLFKEEFDQIIFIYHIQNPLNCIFLDCVHPCFHVRYSQLWYRPVSFFWLICFFLVLFLFCYFGVGGWGGSFLLGVK